MEPFLADFINSTKIPKFLKYILVTLIVGFLEVIFLLVAFTGVTKIAMPLGIILAVLLLVLYIYMIVKIKKYNYVKKEDN